VDEDTGTPVVEDYAGKTTFKFSGKLSKFVIDLTSNPLSPRKPRMNQRWVWPSNSAFYSEANRGGIAIL
jgi:hypothetical protein